MTRSAARRANRNAKRVVAATPASHAAKWKRYEGPFDVVSLPAFLGKREVPRELNWPYVAELMNRKANEVML